MYTRLFVWLSILVTACGPAPEATAPGEPVPKGGRPPAHAAVDELDRPLPLDARITKGRLENGLTYYVVRHTKPEKRAQIWLAVNAGSVLEDDDQRGLAHFVEHMGFNGTQRFPKQELVSFLEKSGVRFGADLNAYTSFDETVYTLQVPTDRPELVERAIAVLRDWAGAVSFDADEVDKERGVVLEEWRLGRGARMRLFDKQAPVLFHGSKYAERITIGKPETIRGASRDVLVRFYRDWYRSDLMAVVAVGDFEPSEVEAQIRGEFASLPAAKNPRPRPAIEVPPHAETLVSIETDPEMPSTTVAIHHELPRRPEKSARDYRRAIGEQLYNSMLNARFDEIRRAPNAPFLWAWSSSSNFVRTADVFDETATVAEDGTERGFAALLEEVLRVERHGFVAAELDRAKVHLLRQFQQGAKERDKIDARDVAAEIVRNFLEDEAMPGRVAELELCERFLPTFSLAELNGMAKSRGAASRVITVTAPAQSAVPTAAAMLAMEKDVVGRDIQRFVDAAPTVPLMAAAPAPGKITSTTTVAEIGVTVWTFDNGVRVVAKPTDFSNDEVRMSAFSPGGTSLVKDADFISAQFADEVVSEGGLGPFDAMQLRKALADKVVSLQATISELEEGLSGNAAAGDLETMLQLAYLSFTAPRRDERAFTAWRARESEGVRNRRLSPERVFREDLQVFSTQDHPRRQPTTPEIIAKIDLDASLAFYQERFADAGDFTFVFVGNFEIARLRELTARYLGSLPEKKRKETWRDVNVRLRNGVQTHVVRKGSEPKSSVSLTFHGGATWSRAAENDMRMLAEVLRHRLRQLLREELGGVYGVQVTGGISRRPRPEYRLNVSFGCSPDKVDLLKQAVLDEIAAIQKSGAADELLAKIKEARRRSHEVELEDNGFWLNELERAYTYADDPRLIPEIADLVDAIRSDRVRAAAKRYANTREYLVGVLTPEATVGSVP